MARTRVQSIRSNVTGARPASQEPGTIFTNWPDRQIGVVDSARQPLDLVGIRFFSATAAYAAGAFVVNANKIWRAKAAVSPAAFNAAQWDEVGTDRAIAYVGDNPAVTGPAEPRPGELWWESDTGSLYIWYDDGDSRQWVEVKGGAALGSSAVPSDWVTPQMCGAKADGVTDDTAAIQAALNTTARHIHFPAGNYRIVDTAQNGTRTLISTLPKRRITCDGTITATSHVYIALQIDGDDNTIQINIDGTGGSIANGLRVYGARPIIEGCRIENLYTTVFSAVGINAITQAGGLIRGNIVRNINATTNLSRGIIHGCGEAASTHPFIIENNIVDNIIGDEGDSIVSAGSIGGGVYLSTKTIIRGNTITTFSRRAIKAQAHDVQILDNTIRSEWTDISQIPNRQSVINLTQGSRMTVRGNLLEACHWFSQINMSGQAPESHSDIVVENNIIRGLGADTTASGISMTTLGTNLLIRGNIVQGLAGTAIAAGGAANVVIDGNIVSCADGASVRTISCTSTCTNVVVTNNVMTGGNRRSFIELDCVDAVIANNHARSPGVTTIPVRGLANANTLVVGNTAFGAASFDNDYTGNRLGPNYVQGNPQSNFFPGPLMCVASTGPTLQFAGRYVSVGQIAFDTSPTAGGRIGWVAMASGLAEAVTWKPFGAIDA